MTTESLFSGHGAAGCLIGILAAFLFSAATAAELHIVATSDLHGQAAALSELAPAIRAVGPEAIRADIGDLEQGTFLSAATGGLVMTEALNALNYDIFVPGNHEFELGFAGFSRLCGSFNGRVLGADWRWRGERPAPWMLIERGGVRAAVIGLTDPRMPGRMFAGDDATFSPPYTALEKIMPDIRAAAPEAVILLWHNGEYWPSGNLGRLLHDFPEIDLVVGGHTHDELPGRRIGGKFFVQPGARGSAAAHIVITIDDSSRRLVSISSSLLRPAAEADPTLREIIASRQPEDPLIAVIEPPLRLPARGEHNSRFGVIAAKALAAAAQTDAALFYTSTREIAPRQRLTASGLYRMMPYRNRICIIEIGRDELRALLEERLEYIRKYPAALAATGFSFTTDRRGRLASFSAPERMTLALSDYLASGSPLLRRLADDPARRFRVLTETTERDAVSTLLRRSAR